jgi:hypothetical protein
MIDYGNANYRFLIYRVDMMPTGIAGGMEVGKYPVHQIVNKALVIHKLSGVYLQ